MQEQESEYDGYGRKQCGYGRDYGGFSPGDQGLEEEKIANAAKNSGKKCPENSRRALAPILNRLPSYRENDKDEQRGETSSVEQLVNIGIDAGGRNLGDEPPSAPQSDGSQRPKEPNGKSRWAGRLVCVVGLTHGPRIPGGRSDAQ